MKPRIPHPLRARRARRDAGAVSVITAATEAAAAIMLRSPVRHTVTVKHEPRPPAPRPSRLTVVWVMQNGQELRQFVSLTGQRSTTQSVPQWVKDPTGWGGGPIYSMRFEFGYEEGAPW